MDAFNNSSSRTNGDDLRIFVLKRNSANKYNGVATGEALTRNLRQEYFNFTTEASKDWAPRKDMSKKPNFSIAESTLICNLYEEYFQSH